MANGDWLPCRLIALSVETVSVDQDGAGLPLPRARCAAIHLAPSLSPDAVRACPTQTLQFVRLRNDDVAAGVLARSDPGHVTLRRGNRTWTAPTSAVAEVWSEGPNFVPLSTLKPDRITYTPQFDESFPVSYDRDASNSEVSLRGRRHARAIACHPRTEILYRLAHKWTGFVAEIGIADTAPPHGVADFRIAVNGKTVFEKKGVSRKAAAVPVNIDLTNATALTLTVDYGPDGSAFGAHAVWARSMLVK